MSTARSIPDSSAAPVPDAGVYHLNYVPGVTPINDVIYVGGPFTVYNDAHRLGLARLEQ